MDKPPAYEDVSAMSVPQNTRDTMLPQASHSDHQRLTSDPYAVIISGDKKDAVPLTTGSERHEVPDHLRAVPVGLPFTPVEDNKSDDFNQFQFDDKTIRRAFIKKVYSLVMVQLLVTLAFIAFFLFNRPLQQSVMRKPSILYGAVITYVVSVLSIACCEAPRRRVPYNFILLGVLTLSSSLVLGVGAARYNAVEVLMAVGVTAAICLALTLFAFQTRWDFTTMGGMLLSVTIVLLIFGIIAAVTQNPSLKLLYAAIGVIIFSCYLVYDTQLMIGGEHKYTISPEDYVFAAMNIYLDIIILFTKILRLLR